MLVLPATFCGVEVRRAGLGAAYNEGLSIIRGRMRRTSISEGDTQGPGLLTSCHRAS